MKYIVEIKPEPISGIETKDLFKISQNSEFNCEYVLIKNALTFEPIINLKVESDYSPTFKQSEVWNGVIITGYGNRFSIFDLSNKEIKVNLSFDWYFGSFTVDEGDVFIATDSEIISVNFQGVENWRANNLGIDGVLISTITETEITGIGEFDPPGGWESFILNRKNGKIKR